MTPDFNTSSSGCVRGIGPAHTQLAELRAHAGIAAHRLPVFRPNRTIHCPVRAGVAIPHTRTAQQSARLEPRPPEQSSRQSPLSRVQRFVRFAVPWTKAFTSDLSCRFQNATVLNVTLFKIANLYRFSRRKPLRSKLRAPAIGGTTLHTGCLVRSTPGKSGTAPETPLAQSALETDGIALFNRKRLIRPKTKCPQPVLRPRAFCARVRKQSMNHAQRSFLPNDLRARVNRLAHVAAQKHEIDERARILAELQRMQTSDADLRQLHHYLDNQ